MTLLAQPLTLACGLTLPNRLAKAAMTEGLADPHGRPSQELERLYRLWSHGRTGLLITGNVPVDADHLERAGNVVIDREPDAEMRERLEGFARAAKEGGSAVIVQLSHAGRQTPGTINMAPKAPSDIGLASMPGMPFGDPTPMTADDIVDVEARFATASRAAMAAGFDGVQIHAAHGYLLSSFLSPLVNVRGDQWGGALESRAKLLLDIVRRVRTECPAPFAISVKLNSADFQRGGFAIEDSEQVARWLDEAGVDLIEISGGSYEQAAMMGDLGEEPSGAQKRTAQREAYFVKFAPGIRAALTNAKLMVTGGFRSRAGMESAIEDDGVDLIGIARPLIAEPAASNALLAGGDELPRIEAELRVGPGIFSPQSRFAFMKTLNAGASQVWYYEQLDRMGAGDPVDPKKAILRAAISYGKRDKAKLKALKALKAVRAEIER